MKKDFSHWDLTVSSRIRLYTNNGSLYLASLAFLPLGLSADHPFWTSPSESWTSKKAWEGEEFPKDHTYYEKHSMNYQ